MVCLVGATIGWRLPDGHPSRWLKTNDDDRGAAGGNEVEPGGEAWTDPGGFMAGVGVVAKNGVVQAGCRRRVVVLGAVLTGGLQWVITHLAMGSFVRQPRHGRTDHQPAGNRCHEPPQQGSDQHEDR